MRICCAEVDCFLKLRALLQLLQNFPCSQETCDSAGWGVLGWRWLELWLRHGCTGAVVAGRAALGSWCWTLHGILTHQSSVQPAAARWTHVTSSPCNTPAVTISHHYTAVTPIEEIRAAAGCEWCNPPLCERAAPPPKLPATTGDWCAVLRPLTTTKAELPPATRSRQSAQLQGRALPSTTTLYTARCRSGR